MIYFADRGEMCTFAAAKETGTADITTGKSLHSDRGVEQLVARQAHNLEVARSSPASATAAAEGR